METRCSNDTWSSACHEEASGPLAVIVVPSLLALSTVVVVAGILCSLLRKRRARGGRSAPPTGHTHYANGRGSVSLGSAHRVPSGLREALSSWELPAECVLDGLEFWQTGCYGPICTGQLRREGGSTPVVVKSLREGPHQPEVKEFLEWVLFHATVCKHEGVVRMLQVQTHRAPMYLVLEAQSPGNLLHFLWTLRKRDPVFAADPSSWHFSEKSVFLVAKQVAAGLDYLMADHRLVHGDVAARNILLGPGLCARVSGLGAAFARRQKGSAAKWRTAEVPLKWQAPERIMKQPITNRSDVWSFGILLYELISLGSPPYPEMEPLSVFPRLERSYRMERPENCGGPLYDLMKYCWMWSFKERPAFSALTKLLDTYLDLASTTDLHVPDAIDLQEYSKKAGVLP